MESDMAIGGFLKGLGKGALKFGGLAAAPFTGGASLIPSLIGAGGAVASGIAGGRAAGREKEAGINQSQDLLRLQAARLNLDAPQSYARNSVRGDILAGLQPVSFSGGGRDLRMGGGLSPALLSQNSRQLGQNMSRDALLASMKGPAFEPTRLPQSGKLDSILNITSPIMSGLGAIGAMRGKQPVRTPPFNPRPITGGGNFPTFNGVPQIPKASLMFDPYAEDESVQE